MVLVSSELFGNNGVSTALHCFYVEESINLS